MTTSGAVSRQRAGGKLWYWLVKTKEMKRVRRAQRQQKGSKHRIVDMTVGALNVGTMSGKGRKLADMVERRKVDTLFKEIKGTL